VSAIVVASLDDVRKYARGALSLAGALDTFPVPLADIEAAVGLHPAQELYTAGQEIPPRFVEFLKKIQSRSTRVLGALGFGQNTIYLDPEMPEAKHRFTHGHELGHKALPWHYGAYIDDGATLIPSTRDELEQEANAFSAQLQFGVGKFTQMAEARPASLAVPLDLSTMFAASAHASVRHYVSESSRPMALLVLGKYIQRRGGRAGLPVFGDHCVESAAFRDRYGLVTDLFPQHVSGATYPFVAHVTEPTSGLHEGETEVVVETKRGSTSLIAQCATLRLHFVLLRPRPRLHFRGPHVQIVHTQR
jgi:hypothetical protein